MVRRIGMGLLWIAILSAACAAAVVHFSDPGLEAAIREAIDRPSGSIYDYHLTDLETLEAHGRAIAKLDGIEYCTSLTALDLSNNEIVDLAPLAHLTRLISLDLTDNLIADVSPIASLRCLTKLRLGENDIVDLAPLAGFAVGESPCELLNELELGGNRIADVSPLAGLTSLQRLTLERNAIVDIAALGTLQDLALLNLTGNHIQRISSLASLLNLQVLLLDDNAIVDIAALSGLERLFGLWLSGNPIADLQPLVDNPGLDFGDRIYICSDRLDHSPGSRAEAQLLDLTRRGIYVYECW